VHTEAVALSLIVLRKKMNMIRSILTAMLLMPCVLQAIQQSTNSTVIVWYETTLIETSSGEKVQKTMAIPWHDKLTFSHAIAAAGGYSTPPYRYLYLIRNGKITLINTTKNSSDSEYDIILLPEDRIELRSLEIESSKIKP